MCAGPGAAGSSSDGGVSVRTGRDSCHPGGGPSGRPSRSRMRAMAGIADGARSSSLATSAIGTWTTGTPACSAASGPANSQLSWTSTSGRHSSIAAWMPGSAAGASMPAKISPTTSAFARSVVMPQACANTDARGSGGDVVDVPHGEAGRHDRRGRRAPDGHEHLVAGGPQRAGEGQEGADVTGASRGGEEDPHARWDARAGRGIPRTVLHPGAMARRAAPISRVA